MKMPRWLVVSLLSISVLSALGAAGYWWVTWPERTAREYVEDGYQFTNEQKLASSAEFVGKNVWRFAFSPGFSSSSSVV
jgi:hypothetical protein